MVARFSGGSIFLGRLNSLPKQNFVFDDWWRKRGLSGMTKSDSMRIREVDIHYTPSSVAKSLITALRDLRPQVIADLAAGRGDLLLEAERCWPRAAFVATDIDPAAARHLTRRRPNWAVGRCDLRSSRSRASCRVLQNIRNSACLLLLNPPFSCRGAARYAVKTENGFLYASTAMSFLLVAAEYLNDKGHIAAVLPLGCISNLKDERAWQHLRHKYSVTLLNSYTAGVFPGSAASIALVRLSPHQSQLGRTTPIPRATSSHPRLRVYIIRGSCPSHCGADDERCPTLVHYTDIQRGSIVLNGRRGHGNRRSVTGPAIVIPRVGRFTTGKIGILKSQQPVMLSDCVIAIKPLSSEQTSILRDRLIQHFALLSRQYVGTGAPFITVGRLENALEAMGVDVEQSA